MSNLSLLINEAPTFKDLLWAIMDENRSKIAGSEFWIFLETRIRSKCEEAALNLKSSITLQELELHSSNLFFKTLGSKYTNCVLLDTIQCICDKLDLEFDEKTISWANKCLINKRSQ